MHSVCSESVYFTVLTLAWSKFLSLTSKLWIILYGFNHFTEFKRFLTLKGKKKPSKGALVFLFLFLPYSPRMLLEGNTGQGWGFKVQILVLIHTFYWSCVLILSTLSLAAYCIVERCPIKRKKKRSVAYQVYIFTGLTLLHCGYWIKHCKV